MIAAGVFIVLGVLVCAVQHAYWARRVEDAKAERDSAWTDTVEATRENYRGFMDELAAERRRHANTRARLMTLSGDLARARSKRHDMHTMLVAEQARTSILEDELSRIAEQVKGKCLWPTLAEDDVVVRLRSVDGGAR